MFSTITKFNEELGNSVLNLNYSMYIIVFTYLIIPTDFMKLVNNKNKAPLLNELN